MIEILGICGRLSYGEEKFLEEKKMMPIDHIRLEGLQIPQRVLEAKINPLNQMEDVKPTKVRQTIHNLVVFLKNLVQDKEMLLKLVSYLNNKEWKVRQKS